MRISDWSSDVCSSDLVVDELVAHGIDVGGQVGADIGEAAFIGRFALRIGVGAAQIELDAVEIELGDELGVDQLAFVPRRVLLPDVAVGLVAVGAESEAGSEEHTSELQSLIRNYYAFF